MSSNERHIDEDRLAQELSGSNAADSGMRGDNEGLHEHELDAVVVVGGKNDEGSEVGTDAESSERSVSWFAVAILFWLVALTAWLAFVNVKSVVARDEIERGYDARISAEVKQLDARIKETAELLSEVRAGLGKAITTNRDDIATMRPTISDLGIEVSGVKEVIAAIRADSALSSELVRVNERTVNELRDVMTGAEAAIAKQNAMISEIKRQLAESAKGGGVAGEKKVKGPVKASTLNGWTVASVDVWGTEKVVVLTSGERIEKVQVGDNWNGVRFDSATASQVSVTDSEGQVITVPVRGY